MRPEGPWHGGRPGRGPADPQMRVGDAERNQVAEALSQHFSDGRLDSTEMKERLDRAMGAKTRGDLAGLVSDLPPLGPVPAPAPRRHRLGLWLTAFAVLAFLSVPWQYAHWMWFPRVPWLLVGLVGVFVWRRGRRRHRLATGG